jgi:peptidoglycan/LPS O-acetylase OafA/YrhL
METIMTRPVRKYLYAVTIAAIALLAGLNYIDPDQVPLWLGFAAAILGIAAPMTAITHLTPADHDYATVEEIEIEGQP